MVRSVYYQSVIAGDTLVLEEFMLVQLTKEDRGEGLCYGSCHKNWY